MHTHIHAQFFFLKNTPKIVTLFKGATCEQFQSHSLRETICKGPDGEYFQLYRP